MGEAYERVLILMLAIATLAAARDKKPKAQPGPYVFNSKATAQNSQTTDRSIQSKGWLHTRLRQPVPVAFLQASTDAIHGRTLLDPEWLHGPDDQEVWSYTLVEMNGATTVTVQPVWEYPGDYCTHADP